MLRNTGSTYGSIAKWLHWVMAVWVLATCTTIYYLTWRHSEFPLPGLNYHKVLGFSLLLPLSIRICWRFISPAPRLPDNIPVWQKRLSHVSHFGLYALLLVMPVSGYLGNGGGVDYGFFRIPAFSNTELGVWTLQTLGMTYAQWDLFFDRFHYGVVGPYVLSTFVVVHVGAAVYHHFVQKDDVLVRMLPDRVRAENSSRNATGSPR
jgi:cytochrome b561